MAEYTKTAMEQLTSEPVIRTGIDNKQIELWSPWTKLNTPGNRQEHKPIELPEEMLGGSRLHSLIYIQE